ncbi:S8 family peptidase [Candidatus Puniceispirillum marinum]|uniref:Predicted subtilase n=1 Tax=Puniceispirillum marinum (strain IMCC1322) TaxID=488538 RepID=D5BT33_PUNMI|nr:S8 family peptidase [Candidatus Puniceispirillum marinum]ADE39430.1 predicted subtilase [Candidatus Puniceispirillum marinum IMCC1322]
MIPRQTAYTSGSRRFFPRYILPALLLGTLAACGGGGGGGSGATTSLASLQTSGKPWLGDSSTIIYDPVAGIYTGWGPSNHQRLSYAHGRIGLGSAIQARNTGANVQVAVVDDGVDVDHPELQDNILKRPDGQIVGRSFLDRRPSSDHGPTLDRGRESISHGTHVAGIIAAADNGRGVRGVAPGAKIIPVRYVLSGIPNRYKFSADIDPDHEYAANSATKLKNIMKYINDDTGAFVMNNSWGYTLRPRVKEVALAGGKKGYFLQPRGAADYRAFINKFNHQDLREQVKLNKFVTVFAAGNDGWNAETGEIDIYKEKFAGEDIHNYLNEGERTLIGFLKPTDSQIAKTNTPANIPSLLSAYFVANGDAVGKWLAVVATDRNNRIAPFSNGCGIAKAYCLAAPGTRILSTFDRRETGVGAFHGYGVYSGTSMAAPMVSGALAVLKGKDPQLTAEAAVRIVLDTATDLGAPGVDDVYGHGLLNLARALEPIGATRAAGRHASPLSGFDPRQNAVAFSTAFGNGGAGQSLTSGVFDKYNRSYQMKTPLQAPIRKAPSLDSLMQFHHGKVSAASRTVALDGDGSLFYSLSDDRFGQRGKGVSFDMFGDIQGTHYRTHLAFAKAQTADSMMPSSTNKSMWAGLGSHSRDHMQGRFDTALNENLWLGIYTGRGQLGGTGTSTRTDRADDDGSYRFDDVGISLAHRDKSSKISLSAGQFFEHGRFLASRGEGAFQLDKATRTNYLHLGAAAALSARMRMSADYMTLKTKVDFRHNAYVDDMSLDADSADVRLTVTDVIADKDYIAIGYRLPLAVRQGAMTQHSVKGYDMTGKYNVAVDQIDFAVPKRHRIAHISYVRQLKARSYGDAAFRWFVEAASHQNWGNMAGKTNRHINAGLIASF